MKKFVCLALVSIGMLWSCVPVPEENPEPGIPVASMLLKKIVETDEDGLVTTDEFTYVGKKISQIVSTDGTKTIFTYEGDLIVKEETFDTANVLLERNTYTYSIGNNLSTYTNIIFDNDGDANDDSYGERWVFVYNLNGTVSYDEFVGDATSQTEHYIDGTITNTQYIENNVDPITMEAQTFTGTFTFDLKNNPFKNVVGYDKIHFAGADSPLNFNNNVLTQTDQIDSDAAVLLNRISYTYTTNNFPLTATTTNGADEVVSTEQFFYY